MKRTVLLLMVLVFGSGILLSQSINLKTGLFIPSLQSELWDINLQNLDFTKTELINICFSAEYELFLNRHTSFSMEIGSYTKKIETQYKDYTFQDDSPIFQNMSLRITSMEANVKIYPLGHGDAVSPFFGAGAGIYAWTYRQWGDFINFEDESINNGFAETKTYSLGFNGRAGLLFRFNPRMGLTLEGKYQYLRGRLSRDFEGFDLLDLGGISATVGININFK